MPRSLWSGSLSFGLVTVPIKIVSAVQQKEIRFHQVHLKDGARIRYHRVCEREDKEVDYAEIAKVTGGSTPVMITKEELKSLEAEKSELIDILDFVRMDQVDPVYFEKPYYLVPDKGGDKSYRLLREAMADMERVAIAKFVFRSKEKLVVIRPFGRALTLTMMNYGDEVLLPEDIEGVPSKGATSKKELSMAKRLIDELATDWDPKRYKDEHRARIEDLIEVKRKGGILLPMPKAKRGTTTDLVAALEASLAKRREEAKA